MSETRKRRGMSAQVRFSVLSRDRFTCRYCSRSAPDVELHVDHVKAVANGGTDDMDNLVTACVDCNLGKSDKDVPFVPETCSGRHIPRIHPLLGRGFLSFKEGKCKEQGVITAVIDDDVGTLLVLQFFEWMGGSTTYQRVIPISRIVFDDASTASGLTYRLFEDNDDRNDYYEWKGGLFEDGAR